MTPEDGEVCDRLARGEAVPGGPGACTREGCGHLTLWHRKGSGYPNYKRQPCEKCRCPRWTDEPGAVMPPEPDVQLNLFDAGLPDGDSPAWPPATAAGRPNSTRTAPTAITGASAP